jgi:UDP-N-acetylmuramoyl-tripeptide--D-alanyl-D-alanine ligase
MKRFFKAIVISILARQVRSLRARHHFTIIGVVGGIGKTSTKMAIAQSLGKTLRVRYQEGNYNDIVSVPLIFFGHAMPSLLNPFAWLRMFINNAQQIRGNYPFDVVVVELGTDRLGQIAAFQKYLELDYAIVTAIVPEHMEYLGDMQSVASEELSVAGYSEKLIYNADLVAREFRQPLQGAISYGMKQPADYRLANVHHAAGRSERDITHNDKAFLRFNHEVASEIQLYSVLAAVTVGNELGLTRAQIRDGIAAIRPVSGRLRLLRGIRGSIIIDDTYNALPDAVKAGLETLSGLKAPQKVAILGNMNQLGAMSPQAHTKIGELCDPTQLSLVITIGPDANAYLAPAAAAKGCVVQSFNTPYEAGEYLRPRIEHGAIILAKGSQDNVFAEEAIKLLLADPEDASKLVRQSAYWLKRKRKSF